jgi:glycosyltransferase involved in cell wall biosynthesis
MEDNQLLSQPPEPSSASRFPAQAARIFSGCRTDSERKKPAHSSMARMISIVIPAKNEAANLPPLLDEIETALSGREFEVIVVDDGSTDDTPTVLAAERERRDWPLRHLRHVRSGGQSMALRSGVMAARGELIGTLDADGQNDPAYLPRLIDAVQSSGPDTALAAGRRVNRKHTRLKNFSSRFANGLRAAILKDETPDSGCGLKVMRTAVFRRLPFFDGTHRFLPALVMQEGFRTVHVDVVDRPRLHGTSHYGIVDRGLRGALDLFGVWWLQKRRRNTLAAEEIGDE